MTDPVQFSDTVRAFMDLFMQRSMRSWKHFARNSGLSMSQYSILMQLHHHGPCSISDISERFDTTSAAASQIADKLVQAGLLERAEDPEDRRAKLLTLSPKGQELVENGVAVRFRWVDDLADHLSPEERQKVSEGLRLMTRAAEELDPDEHLPETSRSASHPVHNPSL
jgi:DNA-binding MarR family transcriptional regulator